MPTLAATNEYPPPADSKMPELKAPPSLLPDWGREHYTRQFALRASRRAIRFMNSGRCGEGCADGSNRPDGEFRLGQFEREGRHGGANHP